MYIYIEHLILKKEMSCLILMWQEEYHDQEGGLPQGEAQPVAFWVC